mgnify:CR=1 FL=1
METESKDYTILKYHNDTIDKGYIKEVSITKGGL